MSLLNCRLSRSSAASSVAVDGYPEDSDAFRLACTCNEVGWRCEDMMQKQQDVEYRDSLLAGGSGELV
jgi:hypothetical protein